MAASFYYELQTYVLTETQLQENNYPGWSCSKKSTAKEGLQEYHCSRCKDGFSADPDVHNSYSALSCCVFHNKKLHSVNRKQPDSPQFWTCCGGSKDSPGCTKRDYHITSVQYKEGENYRTTEHRPQAPPNVLAIDCEMVYTTGGMELGRVSVVDDNQTTLMDTFVKPQHQVLDVVTEYSGITEERVRNASRSLMDVQEDLLRMIHSKTILIGHSLENDLKALRMIHSHVVDTSIVFPHAIQGYKHALKQLVGKHLWRTIQTDPTNGHSSVEDACATMDLMLHKLKLDKKQQEEEKIRQEEERKKRKEEEREAKEKALCQDMAKRLAEEPPKSCQEPVSTFRFRFPDGKTLTRRFLADQPLTAVFNFVTAQGYLTPGSCRVLTLYPRTDLTTVDSKQSLKDLKLISNHVLNVEKITKKQ